MKQIKQNQFIIIVCFFIFCINFSLIFNNNVWCDEAFIINACRLDFRELLSYIATDDMRPPLYLITVKIWTAILGHEVWKFKLFSILPCILTILIDGSIIKKNWGKKSFFIFALLVGLSPASMTKNIEITIYSWTMFWVTTNILLAYEFYKNQSVKYRVLFIITSLGAAATHYYALIVEIFIYTGLFIILLVKNPALKTIKNIIGISMITIVAYLPVLPFFIKQFMIARQSFWILETEISVFPNSMRMLFEGENKFTFSNEFSVFMWGIIFFLFYFICIEIFQNNHKLTEDYIYLFSCFCICLLLPISGYIISLIIRPLYISRYYFCVSGILWIFISVSISFLKKKDIYLGISALITVMFIFNYPIIYEREYTTETQITIDKIAPNLGDDDIFINNIETCASWVLEYYFPQHEYFLDNNQGVYYKDQDFDFTTLNQTAWYFCQGDFPLSEAELNDLQIDLEYIGEGNFDNYYYVSIYKLTPQARGEM